MNMTFKERCFKEWTLYDDRIILGKKVIMLSSITKVEQNPGFIRIFFPGFLGNAALAYPYAQAEDAKIAVEYIINHASVKAKEIERQKRGIRKRCNVCGHIFCYNYEDIERNKQLERNAELYSFSSLGGTYASSASDAQTAEALQSRIIDYDKCPKCGSRDLSDATDEDIARMKNPQGPVAQQTSPTEEIKRFKELLDIGAITQEEFDAKKKQLLGL